MTIVKHGFYSTAEIILPGESEDLFHKQLEEAVAEFKPEGWSEMQAVVDLVRLHLDKARVTRITRGRFDKDSTGRDPENLGKRSGAELDYFEKATNLEARIDGRIDKKFALLARLKEYKRYEASQAALKQLPASPPIAPALDAGETDAEGVDLGKVEPGNAPVDPQPKEDTP